MGRIKSALIKRTAKNLAKEPNKFDDTFNTNKNLLKNSMPSKRLRNRIAGYITRMRRNEKAKKERMRNITDTKEISSD
jgi:small subunit ribosomal protein S17e